MARGPEDDPRNDPRVTDLRRYKKAREQAKRRPPPKPPSQRGGQGFLGSNPRAGLILAAVAALGLALWVLPAILRFVA